MNENLIGVEENLYLAPEEKNENAKEIAELSLEMEKNSYIIKYTPTEGENIISELEKIGCFDFKQLNFANCVAVLISNSQLKAIKTLDCVETVERDYDYKILVNSVEEGNLVDRLSGEKSNNILKKEIRIAVFDTGVSDLAINGSVSFVDKTTEDNNGHGTQMARIISDVIGDAEDKKASVGIYSVTVANHSGFAKTSTVMEAIDWAIKNRIKIISMSFGDYHKSNLLEEMIDRASKSGIIMVAAAGNDGDFEDESRIMYPAAFDKVISVGAKNGETVADYSNGGTNVDCLAPGTQNVVDINGNAVSVIGTSASAAFVAGVILKKWCVSPKSNAEDITADIKSEMASQNIRKSGILTSSEEYGIIINENGAENSETVATVAEHVDEILFNDNIALFSVNSSCDNGCSSNDMASAISLPFLNWRSGSITCPGNEVWYKFTANASGVHPNGSPGWYTVHTQGSLDTVGYLYDSYGNQIAYNDDGGNGLNFNFRAQLDYYETYYIRVKAFGNNTGNFDIRVSYFSDDHGNTPDTATEVVGVYYSNKSVLGHLHSQSDVDYYTFVPARNCVMEIYTEGDTDTYGRLYCASGGLLYSDNNSNGNGNFKITAHLEAMKRYYIAVSHNSSTGYGDYTLRFKFVRDWMNAVSGQYNIALWKNTDTPNATSTDYVEISRAFVTADAASEYYAVIVEDLPSHKPSIGAAIESGVRNELWSALRDSILDLLIPNYADFASLLLNVGQVIYDNMDPNDIAKDDYKTLWNIVRDGGTHIVAINSQKKTLLGNYSDNIEYSAHGPFNIFYGSDYQRGNFTIVALK